MRHTANRTAFFRLIQILHIFPIQHVYSVVGCIISPPKKKLCVIFTFPFLFCMFVSRCCGPRKTHKRKTARRRPHKIKQITKQREDAKYIVWILYSIFNWSYILHPTWRRRTNQKSSGKKKLLNVKIVTCRCVVYGGPTHKVVFHSHMNLIIFILFI